MKKFIFVCILFSLFIFACKTNSVNTQKNLDEGIGTPQYYQKYQRNIDRLYQMLQGTFISYNKKDQNVKLTPWLVGSNQDSVITYSIPIKEPAKDGYWLICYQFITGLPDEPIYCALQKLTVIDRDTFLSEFFEPPVKIKLSAIIKDLEEVDQSINLKGLVQIDEIITYYRKEITIFKGHSNIYKNHQTPYLTYRRENYEVHPDKHMFNTIFSEDIKGEKVIDRGSSPAFQIRTQKEITDMIDQSLLEN